MTDTTQDVNPEAEAQDAEAATENETPNTSEQDSQPTGFDSLPDETKAEIRKLRRENAKFRNEAKAAEDAQKTEAQRREEALQEAEERASKAEQRYRQAVGRAAVTEEAAKSGAISPRAIHALIQDGIDFDENGSPSNIAELVKQLQADEPALFRTPSLDGGKGKPVTGQDMNALIRRAAGRK